MPISPKGAGKLSAKLDWLFSPWVEKIAVVASKPSSKCSLRLKSEFKIFTVVSKFKTAPSDDDLVEVT